MDKGVLDTFEGLNLTDRQKKIFADVIVKRVVLSKQEGIVTVYLTCSHVIAYREIMLLRNAIASKLECTGVKVEIKEEFALSDAYSPTIFWEEYKDSILLLLKEKNVLLFNMVYRGKVEMEGNSFLLLCEKDMLFQAREQEFCDTVAQIFRKKAGYLVSVSVDYSLEVEQKENEGYEVYTRTGFFCKQPYYRFRRVPQEKGRKKTAICSRGCLATGKWQYGRSGSIYGCTGKCKRHGKYGSTECCDAGICYSKWFRKCNVRL